MLKIYFDMDGVLADFDRGILDLCGMDLADLRERGEDDQIMWKKARAVSHFYDRLEMMPGAKEMFDRVYNQYKSQCEILTGIPKPRRGMLGASEDKEAWVRRLLSKDIVVNIVYKEEKPVFCSGKESILIDDTTQNIKAWNENGGTGILHTSATDTIDQLMKLGILS